MLVQSLFKTVQALDPVAQAAGTTNGIAVDTQGFDVAIFNCYAGTVGASGTIDFKLQESDTSGGTYTDITGATVPQIAAANDNALYKVRARLQKGRKRFLRVVSVVATATCPVSAWCDLTDAKAEVPIQTITTEV